MNSSLDRGIESMAVEMSFGIIFIGNGKLSTSDFARFIESHKVSIKILEKSLTNISVTTSILHYEF